MQSVVLSIPSEQGLHARPADLFVRTANRFACDIRLRNLTSSSGFVNAKSILNILALGVYCGHSVEVEADGPDEHLAIRALSDLVNSNFEKTIF